MRIKSVDAFAIDGGVNSYHLLRITTDDGCAGWSEFGDGRPLPGVLSPLIGMMCQRIIGSDPRNWRRMVSDLFAETRFAQPGLIAQAIGALENACLDVCARQAGVPVHGLFGGALRNQIPVYWSQCGMRRVGRPDLVARLGVEPLRSLKDVEALGAEVRAQGFSALKTKIISFDERGGGVVHMPGFAPVGGGPALNLTPALTRNLTDLVAAFQSGAGPDVEIMLDVNFNFRPDGVLALARGLEPLGLRWIEADISDPVALAAVRQGTRTPIASLESVLGRRALLPFLERRAVDVAIIDVMWNGLAESLMMASLADAADVSVACHNYTGPLAALMSAHFASLLPNLTIMEYEVEGAPWRDEILTSPVVVTNGLLQLPDGPGWGAEPDMSALARFKIAA